MASLARVFDVKGDAIDLNVQILFLQGLWSDTAYPRPGDLLSLLRHCYAPFGILLALIQVLLLCPATILLHLEDRSAIFESIFVMLLDLLLGFSIALFYTRKTAFDLLVRKFRAVNVADILDNDAQRETFLRMRNISLKLTVFFNFGVLPSGLFFAMMYYVIDLIPHRKPLLAQWHPYDASVSPAYEITECVKCAHLVVVFISGYSVATFTVTVFVELKMLFSVLCDKIENILDIARQKVDQRNVKDGGDSNAGGCPERAVVSDKGNNNNSSARQLHGGQTCAIEMSQYQETMIDQEVDKPNKDDIRSNVELQQGKGSTPNRKTFDLGRRDYKFKSSKKFSKTALTLMSDQTHIPVDQETMYQELIGEEDVDEDKISAEMREELKTQLDNCIRLHQHLYELANILAKLFNPMFLLNFVVLLVIYGVVMIIATTAKSISMRELGYLAVTFCTAASFFQYNFLANLIKDQSEAVGVACYNSQWMLFSREIKTSLLIIMKRAGIPVQFKPAGIDPLSLKLFGEISYRAYKMFASLQDLLK